MTVTILASVFIVFMLFIALIGFKAIIKQGRRPEDINMERCSICREKFNKSALIEREIGDYNVLSFCPSCISSLQNELVSKN